MISKLSLEFGTLLFDYDQLIHSSDYFSLLSKEFGILKRFFPQNEFEADLRSHLLLSKLSAYL